MKRLFSRRNNPAPDKLRFDIPIEARRRIIISFEQLSRLGPASFEFEIMLDDVTNLLAREYGGLHASAYEAAGRRGNQVIAHFLSCDHEMAVDFIEACFLGFHNPNQHGVEAVNQVFEDFGIGYELTPYIETISDKPGKMFGLTIGHSIEIQRPQIIKKDSLFLHSEVVQPTFKLLADVKYKGANEEFLKAHEHYRNNDFKACLNECLKTFESTMKIICDKKKWTYKQTDTAKTLIQVCLDNGLVPVSSQTQLGALRTLLESGIPTIRNKQGGHGQGVQPHVVTAETAEYVLHMTATTVLFLCKSAGV